MGFCHSDSTQSILVVMPLTINIIIIHHLANSSKLVKFKFKIDTTRGHPNNMHIRTSTQHRIITDLRVYDDRLGIL